jgi:cbb3-type cytochrome oxidase subunit 1
MSHTTNHPEYNYTVVRQFTVMTIVWGYGRHVGGCIDRSPVDLACPQLRTFG